MNLQVRLAKIGEMEQIRHLLQEIATWFKSNEIDQWSHLLSGSADDEIQEAILNMETYILEMHNKIIGTFTVSTKQSEWDLQLWGESNDPSLYLHRLAIGLEFKGSGFGMEAMQCVRSQFRLRQYYHRHCRCLLCFATDLANGKLGLPHSLSYIIEEKRPYRRV